jgi:ribosomal subunit interface protein
MTLRVSGKHMDIGDAFRSRIESRIGEVMGKYFDRGFSGHVTVEKQGSRFAADCNLHLASGTDIQAAGQAQDPQGAFDMAAERIENRLRRYKSKLKAHVNTAVAHEITYRVVESLPEHDHEEVAADYAPAIIAETSMALAAMTVAAAVMELDLKDGPVFVFRNAKDGQVNMVYRRADGNVGWIDPAAIGANAKTN